MKEVVRGSLLSVPDGQKEAALAHGMTSMQIYDANCSSASC